MTPGDQGTSASRTFRAPGRVNLMGDHTDYNGGYVLPMALDRACTIVAAPNQDATVRAVSRELAGAVVVPVEGAADPRAIEPAWGRFVAGAVAALTNHGVRVRGVDLTVTSTVPAGSGLSSSSALAVALTLALADRAGVELDPRDAARVALDAEVRATGVPGGLMDQLTSLLGLADHALLIDCRSLAVTPIAIPPEVAVLVVHCGKPRTLAGSEYAQRRAECEAISARLGVDTLRDARPEQVADEPRARHVVAENARVLATADALASGDLDATGRLMLASHASLRDDYDVSIPELDLLVESLVDCGAAGARLTGAGFGGCVVAVTASADANRVLGAASDRYRRTTGIDPLRFVAHAVDGAAR